MTPLARALVALVALEHVGFLVLEMFLWRHPIGLRVFGQTRQQADVSAKLAANQGLYNGFLAAGLFASLVIGDAAAGTLAIFCLACVIVAGTFGAVTVKRSILFVQAMPAIVALAATLAS